MVFPQLRQGTVDPGRGRKGKENFLAVKKKPKILLNESFAPGIVRSNEKTKKIKP